MAGRFFSISTARFFMSTRTYHRCHTSQCKQDIRCECGGQLAVTASLHALADLGIGFPNGKLEVRTRYSNRVCGYEGWCLRCGQSGKFLLPAEGTKPEATAAA
jgi:hypothetical protein